MIDPRCNFLTFTRQIVHVETNPTWKKKESFVPFFFFPEFREVLHAPEHIKKDGTKGTHMANGSGDDDVHVVTRSVD